MNTRHWPLADEFTLVDRNGSDMTTLHWPLADELTSVDRRGAYEQMTILLSILLFGPCSFAITSLKQITIYYFIFRSPCFKETQVQRKKIKI